MLALAVCMLPGLAMAEGVPAFAEDDLKKIDIPDNLVTVNCNTTGDSKNYGAISGGFDMDKAKPYDDGGVWKVVVQLKLAAYKSQYDAETGTEHNVTGLGSTVFSFTLEYVGNEWKVKGDFPTVPISVTCGGNHKVQQPEMPMYPTTDNISGLNDKIVAVLCTNVPAGQQSGRYYGLLNGGFTSTKPMFNKEDKVYESTITLIPSAYCNQFSADTGITHELGSLTDVNGQPIHRSFVVKYDYENNMWVPKEPVKQIVFWVKCDKHEVQTRYTVTYSDGMNGSVFATESYTDLKKGDTTPTFKGSTYRYGYRFDGWKPAWSATVTGNVTYVAQWTYVGGGGGGHYHPNPTPVPPMIKPPQTGDNSNTTLWLALLLVSGGALVGIAVFAQKRRKTQ